MLQTTQKSNKTDFWATDAGVETEWLQIVGVSINLFLLGAVQFDISENASTYVMAHGELLKSIYSSNVRNSAWTPVTVPVVP